MRKIIIATIMMGISIGLAGCSNSTISDNKNMSTNKITVEEAKEIALKHANLTADQVSFFRVDTDTDDGIDKYNIEFYYENKEYDYEVNAANGEIIEFDYDVEDYNISDYSKPDNQSTNNSETPQNQTGKITAEEAKEIALKHANLTADQVSFFRVETDIDNGIEKYDIEFYYGNKEYDYEINAVNGQIIGYDYDVENYNIPGTQSTNNSGTTQNQAAKITIEEAKEIALKHVNLPSDQVVFGKCELDFDDGIQKYDIEFYNNNKEYNYEIDANTGSILSYEQD